MRGASKRLVGALLFALLLAAGAACLSAALPLQAHAADVTVTANATQPDGTVDVVVGGSGADASGESATYSKTVRLSDITADNSGKVHFDTEATSVYGYIVQITVTCDGNTWTVASCKPDDATADFYKVADGVLPGQSSLSIESTQSEADSRYAPGQSYKHGASFVLTGITSNVTIDVEYDWTNQQTLTFYYNHDGSNVKPVKYFLHYGDALKTPPELPAPEGYTFLGWASSPSGQPVEWDVNARMGLKSLSFYAIWQKTSEPVPPEGEGGIVSPSGDQDNGNGSGEGSSNKGGTDAQGSPASKGSASSLASTGDDAAPFAAIAGAGVFASTLLASVAFRLAKKNN